jgi:hypothetical protein
MLELTSLLYVYYMYMYIYKNNLLSKRKSEARDISRVLDDLMKKIEEWG